MHAENTNNSTGFGKLAISAAKPVLCAVAVSITVTFAFSLMLRFPMLLQGSDAYAFWPAAMPITFEASADIDSGKEAEKTLLLLGNAA